MQPNRRINTTPLGTQKTLSDYARFVVKRNIMAQFFRGSQGVHIISDCPGQQTKPFDRMRRDANATVPLDYHCDNFTGSTRIPA